MKSIKRRFDNINQANPKWSSFICFTEAIKKQKFSRQMIRRWFYKLVEKDDYNKRDKKTLLNHLYKISKGLEDNQK